MAATAYAAAVSLLNTMDTIKIHPLLSRYFNKFSIESLRENVDFFVDFVEKYSDEQSREAEDLLRRIADVAHEAEEIINVEAAHRIRKRKKITQYVEHLVRRMVPSFILSVPAVRLGLQRITEEMNCIKEKVTKLKERTEFMTPQPTYSLMPTPPSSSAPPTTTKTATMVGFDGYVEQLLDQLTGHHSGRQILPIVGMGGIGKTTLATNVYHNSNIMRQFNCRVWVTVSQKFSPRKIYLQALSCLERSIDDTDTDQQLSHKLYKILYNRRYLVVLDDVWSTDAWDKIKFFFPENKNRSRIVVTTRESELVHYFGSSALVVDFLNEKSSWKLFCQKTFAQQGCPHPELEQVGKKIAQKCKGLPLAITVIGGLLRESPSTREYWEKIAEDRSLILDSGDGNINPLSILYLSYKHLPVWLKSCFLYLGSFPEDHEIDVSQLVKLWVAEGFIRSKTEQSLEEVAESYTKELVDRNLILVGRLGLNKKLESCRIHDVVKEPCIRIGKKEKYFCVQRNIDGMCYYIVNEATRRWFCPRESHKTLPSLYHPLILEGPLTLEGQIDIMPFKSRLLRVSLVPTNYLEQVNLRFLCSARTYTLSLMNMLHSSIQMIWSLQTLIVDNIKSFDAPCEIWKMPQLRHIDMKFICLPDPPSPTRKNDVIVLQNLQTLKIVRNLVLREEVCKRIPNIKEFGVSYRFNEAEEGSRCNYHLQNLGCFNKLESLQLCYPSGDSLQTLKFPSSIKELTLYGCKLVWSDMAMVASLPHLQLLKLFYQAFVGAEWNLVDEEFLCLKGLIIVACDDLIYWNVADSSNFPVLETLSLSSLSKLEEIPSDIGEIPTLERMDVEECSESATMSAIKILEEQESLELQLTLNFWHHIDVEIWRKKIRGLGITSQNLHIQKI